MTFARSWCVVVHAHIQAFTSQDHGRLSVVHRSTHSRKRRLVHTCWTPWSVLQKSGKLWARPPVLTPVLSQARTSLAMKNPGFEPPACGLRLPASGGGGGVEGAAQSVGEDTHAVGSLGHRGSPGVSTRYLARPALSRSAVLGMRAWRSSI